MEDEILICYGGEVKALPDGKLGGHLVRFGTPQDPDLVGDYFDATTDFGAFEKTDVYYQHGLDPVIKKRTLGRGDLKKDDVGVWVEAQLNLRDEYEKQIYELAKMGKLGWSSGTAAHLVEREQVGKAWHIKVWKLGLDASLTPTPAEPRNAVIALKSLMAELPKPQANAEGGTDSAANAEPKQFAPEDKPNENKGEVKMDENKTQTPQPEPQTNAIESVVAELKAMRDEIKAMRDAPPANAGGTKAPAHNKIPLGDDAFKAFRHFVRTGDASGIRTGEAYEQFMKTDYHLLESTQYQGQEAVPTEVVARIVEFRNQFSVTRAAGAEVLPVGTNAIVLPVEKANPQQFGITTIDGSNNFTTLTQQPIDKISATIYDFTYNVPIGFTLLEDAVFDVEAWLARYVGRGLGLTENQYFLVGTGSSQPQGAVTGSTKGVDAASASALTAAEIVKLYYSVPAEYRDRVAWVMTGATEATLRQLALSTTFPFVGTGGMYGGVGNGAQANGAGWLVAVNSAVFNSSAMDSIAASKKPVLVGNFEAGYVIFERKGLTVLRDPYSEAGKGIVNLWWHCRQTGGVKNAQALYHILTPTA